MNKEFLKLPRRCRVVIVELFGYESYKETSKPSVDFDAMKHLFPIDKLDFSFKGIGVKRLELIQLWATGKSVPPETNRKSKKIKIFGREFRITITYKLNK